MDQHDYFYNIGNIPQYDNHKLEELFESGSIKYINIPSHYEWEEEVDSVGDYCLCY